MSDLTVTSAMDQFLRALSGFRAPATVTAYRADLTDTLTRLADDAGGAPDALLLRDVDTAALEASVSSFRSSPDPRFTRNRPQENKPRSANTIARRVAAIKQFFAWCYDREFVTSDPAVKIKPPRQSKTEPKNLTGDEAVAVFDAARRSRWPERDALIVALGLACGMRLAEISGVLLADVIGDPPTHMRVLGKGDKTRQVNIPPLVAELIRVYLPTRQERLDVMRVTAGTLIVSSRVVKRPLPNGGEVAISPIPYHTVGEVAERSVRDGLLNSPGSRGRRAGMRTHSLRHTFATLAISSRSLDVRQLQQVLGHESLATTQKYVDVNQEEIAAGMRLHPMAHLK